MQKEMLQELISGILEILKEDTVSIILYGSVARGTATEESDVDIAVLIRQQIPRETREMLDDFLGDLDLKYDKLFSVIDITENKFETWKNVIPFYQNVSREGIVLWKAA